MFKSKYTGEEIEAILDEAKTPYTLPIASQNTLGGIKTNYTQSGKNYPVKTDSSGNAYVNVPWSDTNTTYGVVSTSANGLMPKLPTTNIVTGNNTSLPSMQVLTGDGKYKALDLGYNPILNRLSLGYYEPTTGVGSVYTTIPVASTAADGLMKKFPSETFVGWYGDNNFTPAMQIMTGDGKWKGLDITVMNNKIYLCCCDENDKHGESYAELPIADNTSDGLMSKEDKKNLSSLSEVTTLSYNVPSGDAYSSVNVDIPLRKGCYLYRCTANFFNTSEEIIFMACIGETMGLAPHLFLFCEDAEFTFDSSNAIRNGATWIARLNVTRFDSINTVTVNISKISL